MDGRGKRGTDPIRAAILPTAIIFCAIAIPFLISTAYDRALTPPSPELRSLFALLLEPNAREAKDILGTIGQAIPGVLGIAVTVVAIIVELASNRYTSQVTKLFARDRVNLAVFTLMVVASVYPLWVGSSYGPDFAPSLGFFLSLVVASTALLILIPYFIYLFTFLQPGNIIDAIRQNVRKAITAEAMRQEPNPSARDWARLLSIKGTVSLSVDQLTDMALNSISQRDRALAMDVVVAARGVVFDYFEQKSKLPERWFQILPEERTGNPDYVTLSDEGLEDLQTSRVWVEHKVMKQLHLVFVQALNNLRDLNNLVAMFLRDVAIESLKRGDFEAHRLALKFFNTSLRAAFTARDLKTAYNILFQYREVTTALILQKKMALTELVFGYLKYYGLLFDSGGLGFILETVAHDIYKLLRLAFDQKLDDLDRLLAIFLEVDRQPDAGGSDVHLRGVRKAQSMLAAYFLFHDRRDLAERIGRDMRSEPPERLRSIRTEIHAAERSFWEITDRGVNFDFLEPELHPHLDIFFDSILELGPQANPSTKV